MKQSKADAKKQTIKRNKEQQAKQSLQKLSELEARNG